MKKIFFSLLFINMSFFMHAQDATQVSGFIRPFAGFGYRVAAISDDVKQIGGLEDIAKRQRSGFVFGLEGGFYLSKDKNESLGLLYQRFGSKASGPITAPGSSQSIDFTTDEAISLTALMFNTRKQFGKNGGAAAILKAGAGYNHYRGKGTSIGSAQTINVSKGGLGYILGVDLDIPLSKSIFFVTSFSFSGGSVTIEDQKENLSMLVGGAGIKFNF